MIFHVPCFAWGVQGRSAGPTRRKQLLKERFPDGRSQRRAVTASSQVSVQVALCLERDGLDTGPKSTVF